jgi:hypothetical protein
VPIQIHDEHGGAGVVEEAYRQFVAVGDWEGLRRLMRSVPTLKFNTERNAIQVENCQHEVIASFQIRASAPSQVVVAD